MRVDLRVKHDIEARKAAIGLFERGHGYKSAAKALSVPRGTVRQWLCVYRRGLHGPVERRRFADGFDDALRQVDEEARSAE